MPGEKTEKATQHKRLEQRRKGNVFQSKDIISAFSVLFCFMFLSAYGSTIYTVLFERLKYFFEKAFTVSDMTTQSFGTVLNELMLTIALTAGPILLAAMVLGIVLSVAQTRFIFTTDSIKFKLEKLNPFQGIKKMFSLRSFVELIKSLIKVVAIVLVLYFEIRGQLEYVPSLLATDLYSGIAWMCGIIINIAVKGAAVMIAIGLADYLYQWWEYERSLRMSKQEIKDEYKQMEGDPQTKSRIRSIQRKMAQQRMMAAVPSADVVIRNPQHYAVALKYDADKSSAPVVIAKGMDYLALKIIEIAQKHDVELTEDPPLARALYNTVDVGRQIPENFYKAVADILAYVYDAKRKIGKY